MGPLDHGRSGFKEAPELLGARWMAQLAQRLGLDLADALARDGEVLTYLLERVLAAVGQTEAQAQYLLLARRERVQDSIGLLAQRQADDRLHWGHDLLVLDEVAKMTVLFLADRRLQRDRLLGDLEDLAYLVDRHLHLGRDLFRRGLAAQLLDELARGADQLVDGLDHVHGDANRPRLIGDGAGDRLPDPPGRVRRELIASSIFELVDSFHQPDVALLDDGHDPLDLVGAGVGADFGGLDLLLGHPGLLLFGARELLGRLQVQVASAGAVGALEGGGIAERDVDEVLDLLGRRTATVGPELDHPLGALDVVEQVPQALHEPAAGREGGLPVDEN